MKTKIFKTLDEVFIAAGSHQVTAQELLNGRSYVFGEWQEVQISNDLREEIIEMIVETAGGRGRTKSDTKYRLRNERPQHWAIDRFLLSKYGNSPAHLSYCAGQDQIWEMRNLRNYLKR
jgi:hypothetical protein